MGKAALRQRTIAFAGNPNVGKSTLFNALTGLRQHTGNWPGKTVGVAQGSKVWGETRYRFIDLPGTYSLTGSSEDERLAAEFIRRGEADCTVIVCDGSCLERSLILALQILSVAQKAVVCVNLMDEANRKGIYVDGVALAEQLGVPVVLTSAGDKKALRRLLATVDYVCDESQEDRRYWADPISEAADIAIECVRRRLTDNKQMKWDQRLVSRRFGVPLMLMLLFAVVWLTVWGANYPSQLLQRLLDRGYVWLAGLLSWLPEGLCGFLLDGVYATSARVLAVMLPPMAIFFPLFTVLEDVGYLPRVAFLLDGKMQRCGGCGKQALTMCMGLGCNAVGVTGCRIIESPRERTMAILTNAMIPCNGRFPTLIFLAAAFFSGALGALAVAGCVVLGAVVAMGCTGILTKTASQADSIFLMEMPPFRRPRFGQILIRSLLDRTLVIGGRALKVAAPAGGLLWLLSRAGVLEHLAQLLQPLGAVMGLSGVILVGFLMAFAANELFLPVTLMLLTDAQTLGQVGESAAYLTSWTWQTAVCCMVFCVFHWPCATTLMTIRKETGSIKKTAAAFLLPTAVGFALCVSLNLLFRIFG